MEPENLLPPEAQAQTPAPAPAPQPPAAPPPPAPPALPDLVELNIGGRPYKIERGLAELLQTQQPAPAPVPAPAPAPTDPMAQLDTLWYTNPREAARIIREDVTAQMRAEYHQEQVTNRFWTSLYREAPALERLPRQFVEAVLTKHAGVLRNLPDTEGMRRVGELAQQEALAIYSAFGQTPSVQQPPVLAEGGATPGVPGATPPAPAEDQKPLTLSALIKQRKELRRQSMNTAPSKE